MNILIGILVALLIYSIIKVAKEVRSTFFSKKFELDGRSLHLIIKGIVIGGYFMIALNIITDFIVFLAIQLIIGIGKS